MATSSQQTVGSKAQVWHGTAKHTSGGLIKKDLMKTKSGRIVSRKKHAAGKKAISRLFKLGFKPKKGTFRLMTRTGRKTRRSKGGSMAEDIAKGLSSLQQALTGGPMA